MTYSTQLNSGVAPRAEQELIDPAKDGVQARGNSRETGQNAKLEVGGPENEVRF